MTCKSIRQRHNDVIDPAHNCRGTAWFPSFLHPQGRARGTMSTLQRYAIIVSIISIIWTMESIFGFAFGVRAAARVLPFALKSPSPFESPSVRDIGRPPSVQYMLMAKPAEAPSIEMVSGKNDGEPRIFLVHNLLSEAECEHLMASALKRGLRNSLITPYGRYELDVGPCCRRPLVTYAYVHSVPFDMYSRLHSVTTL